MQWDDSANAGFTTGKPWLAVPPTYKTHNVAQESKDPDSVLSFYKGVLRLRHTNNALLNGNYTAINESDTNVLSYLRAYKDYVVVVALNMTDAPQTITLDLKAYGLGGTKTLLATPKSEATDGKVELPPYGVFIGELTK